MAQYLVWLLFAASFLMPVAKSIDVTGGAAFWHYLSEIWDLPDYWRQIQREPRPPFMSAAQIINELPKLTEAERRAVREKLGLVGSEQRPAHQAHAMNAGQV